MRRGNRLAEGRDTERHCADGQLITDLESLLAREPLAVDERAVRTTEVTDGQLAADIKELTMTSADLGGFDTDHAIVVSAEAGDTICQFERGGRASASDDLKYIVHCGFVPIECLKVLR